MVLADTTAWSWSRRRAYPELRAAFDERLIAGEIATCGMVRLELLHSARSAAELEELEDELDALPQVEMPAAIWPRARAVYAQLAVAEPKHHRTVKHPDLLISAAAEIAGVPVLHYDTDYEAIAAITGQPIEWLAGKGTLR